MAAGIQESSVAVPLAVVSLFSSGPLYGLSHLELVELRISAVAMRLEPTDLFLTFNC